MAFISQKPSNNSLAYNFSSLKYFANITENFLFPFVSSISNKEDPYPISFLFIFTSLSSKLTSTLILTAIEAAILAFLYDSLTTKRALVTLFYFSG